MKLGKRGYIEVDSDYRTSVPSIYAAGDVIGFPALASTSMEQARVAVCHAFGFTYKRQVSELLPYGIYTIPEVLLRRPLRGGREGARHRRGRRARRSTSTTRAARSSATPTAS